MSGVYCGKYLLPNIELIRKRNGLVATTLRLKVMDSLRYVSEHLKRSLSSGIYSVPCKIPEEFCASAMTHRAHFRLEVSDEIKHIASASLAKTTQDMVSRHSCSRIHTASFYSKRSLRITLNSRYGGLYGVYTSSGCGSSRVLYELADYRYLSEDFHVLRYEWQILVNEFAILG